MLAAELESTAGHPGPTRLRESLCRAQQALPEPWGVPTKRVRLLSRHRRAALGRDGEEDMLLVSCQPQAVFLCPIIGSTFSLRCSACLSITPLPTRSISTTGDPHGAPRTYVLLFLCVAFQYAENTSPGLSAFLKLHVWLLSEEPE